MPQTARALKLPGATVLTLAGAAALLCLGRHAGSGYVAAAGGHRQSAPRLSRVTLKAEPTVSEKVDKPADGKPEVSEKVDKPADGKPEAKKPDPKPVSPKQDASKKVKEDTPFGVWANEALATQADAEKKADSADLSERYTARATSTVAGASAGLLETLSENWFVPVGALVLAVVLFVASQVSAPQPQSAPAPAPKPTPVAVKPAPKPVPVEPAPVAAKPAPAPAPAPAPVAAKPAPAPAQPAGPSVGQQAAGVAASGLRGLADLLQFGEERLEAEAPTIQKGLNWASEVNTENLVAKAKEAAPVVGKAIVGATEFGLRTGLQVGSAGLKIASDTLPAVGSAAQDLAVKALPSVQQGLTQAGQATKDTAAKLPSLIAVPDSAKDSPVVQELAKDAPKVVEGLGSALEFAAEKAPEAENFLAYIGGKLLPVAKTALSVGAEVAQDAAKADYSKVPAPTAEQVDRALKSVGVDVGKIADDAGAAVGAQTSKISRQVQDAFKESPPATKVAAPVAAPPAAPAAAPTAPALRPLPTAPPLE